MSDNKELFKARDIISIANEAALFANQGDWEALKNQTLPRLHQAVNDLTAMVGVRVDGSYERR